jgi:hypothetical protein
MLLMHGHEQDIGYGTLGSVNIQGIYWLPGGTKSVGGIDECSNQ